MAISVVVTMSLTADQPALYLRVSVEKSNDLYNPSFQQEVTLSVHDRVFLWIDEHFYAQ